jgi:RNase P protein component
VPTLQLKPGNDYVIIASKKVAETPQDELQAWLKRAVEELARG